MSETKKQSLYDFEFVQCRWCNESVTIGDAKLGMTLDDSSKEYELNPLNEKDVYFDENGKRVWVYCEKCWKEIEEANKDE